MKVFIEGLFLSTKEGEYEGKRTRHVNLLSEDDTVRIKFEDDCFDKFESCKKLKRMDKVSIPCSITFFQGKTYFKALRE